VAKDATGDAHDAAAWGSCSRAGDVLLARALSCCRVSWAGALWSGRAGGAYRVLSSCMRVGYAGVEVGPAAAVVVLVFVFVYVHKYVLVNAVCMRVYVCMRVDTDECHAPCSRAAALHEMRRHPTCNKALTSTHLPLRTPHFRLHCQTHSGGQRSKQVARGCTGAADKRGQLLSCCRQSGWRDTPGCACNTDRSRDNDYVCMMHVSEYAGTACTQVA